MENKDKSSFNNNNREQNYLDKQNNDYLQNIYDDLTSSTSTAVTNHNTNTNTTNTYFYSTYKSSLNTASGVGGRLIIFCNNCIISNLKAQGVSHLHSKVSGTYLTIGGSSGGGSINIFYTNSLTSTCNVSGGSYAYCDYGTGNDLYRHTGGGGGNGTVVSIQCPNIKVK